MSEEQRTDEQQHETHEESAQQTPAGGDAEAPADDAPAEVPEQFREFIERIEQMSVLELNELVRAIESHFGVSAAAMVAAAPAGGTGEGGEESSTVSVELTDVGAQKVAVIKAVKEALGLGLKEAKDLVDGAPVVVKEGVAKEEAEALKKKLEEAGAKVTLK